MSIVIYTYCDPYRLNKEYFWDEITKSPYFCASQTLVNGLRRCFVKEFPRERITTMKCLTESMFPEWTSTSLVVKQHADIDNILNHEINMPSEKNEQENLLKAFRFNRDEVFNSIRTLFELKINPKDIIREKLTHEQKYLLDVYTIINSTEKKKNFYLKEEFSKSEVDTAILTAISALGAEPSVDTMDMDQIVIHGVHQFSPIMLRTIEEISKYKKIILLFNYQNQYKEVYQTWIDIYSAFDAPIKGFSENEYILIDESSVSYTGNRLANNIGKLIGGKTGSIVVDKPYEIIEFDNMTEFASYVADLFEEAQRIDLEYPIRRMKEQIYSANNSVNDILKIYFPEQFGERSFLNYPLGHFFMAITNMWDSGTNQILVTDIVDIKECLSANILKEERKGELLSIFGRMESLLFDCKSINEMIDRLNSVKKALRFLDDQKKEYVSHISYYAISTEDITKLETSLHDLMEIALFFYQDFEKQSNNFKKFYRKLKEYLQNEILDEEGLDKEFTDIVKRVLVRLDEIQNIDATASFECLKATMSIYLKQETKPGKSANWIVRNFEQIDGDILRSKYDDPNIIYHFACLSDDDIGAINQAEFSWPLSDEFFEIAQDPVDWKCQVFVKSRKEYKNFKRYALIYGLQFNHARFKLSYVRRDSEHEKQPFYLFKMLGTKCIPYNLSKISNREVKPVVYSNELSTRKFEFTDYDLYRFRICKFRFLLESLIEGNTVYKDAFLMSKYLEVLLENEIKEEMQGMPISENILPDKLGEIYDGLKKFFPFIQNVNRMDIINNIRKRILNSKMKRFPILSRQDRKYMMIRELFIHQTLEDRNNRSKNVLQEKFNEVTKDQIEKELTKEKMKSYMLLPSIGVWCQYCANRSVCIAPYGKIDFMNGDD